MTDNHLARRSLLKWACAGLAVSACGGKEQPRPSLSPPPAPSSSSSPSTSPIPSPSPSPSPAAYVPLPQEPLPMLKAVAAGFVQALITRRAGQQPGDVLQQAADLLGAGFDQARALAVAAPLFEGSASTGVVVYPQLGGLVPLGTGAQSASVMVIVRQRFSEPAGRVEVVRTCDVRLEVQDGSWKVVELADAGGEPVDRPESLDPRAARVLDDPRIELPDTARWDIHAGAVSPSLLELLSSLAAQASLSVAVLRRGHPPNVFGTDRVSNHTDGRAVDVWRVGGQSIVAAGAANGPSAAVLRAAFLDRRVSQTGAPAGSDLDGAARRSFTDLVHADHLHLAVRTGRPNTG